MSRIADLCEHRNPAAAYLDSSERFFAYISQLALATRSYVEAWEKGRTSSIEFLNLRNEIATLRAGWNFLHEFIKPAIDADTLRLPTALLSGLIGRFRQLSALSASDFVIYHTDEFNYLQVRLTVFKGVADKIAKLVNGPQFPAGLGLIGIPYSQANSLFLNCLIPHEMGHFVFGQLSIRNRFLPKVEDRLKKKIGASLSSVEKSLLAAKVAGMVVRWIEEMFCDLFAVTLIGPCYSLAYIELFDVAKVLDEKGHISLHIYPAEFSDAYPPDLFRVRQQFLLSEDQGWWKELKGTESHYIKCYAAAGKLSDSDFTFPGLSKMFDPAHVDAAAVLDCFFSVLPDLLTELDNATKGLEASVDAWHSHHHLIRTYLEHSVVPSRLHDEATNETIIPSVVSLLNSSYTFYLEQMDKLMERIDKADVNDVGQRSKWTAKVEAWAAKAIEDVELLKKI